MTAYQIASINAANHHRLRNVGAIKPRFWADFVLMSDYKTVKIESVYKKGIRMVENDAVVDFPEPTPPSVRSSMNPADVRPEDLKIPAKGKNIRVIDILPSQIVTGEAITPARIRDGYAESDVQNDILKIVVIERHKATGRIGKAFVRGFGLKKGAIGSTVAHDAHNIVIVGTNDEDIYAAFKRIKSLQGGFVAMADGRVVAELPLPVAGLLSDKRFEQTARDLAFLKEKVKTLGGTHDSPFMILSFLCLSPIPRLKVTDLGLIDVDRFEVVSLFTD